MSVRDFALLHSLSVSSVALEAAHSHQQQLDKWVQATPRLNKQQQQQGTAATGGSKRELQALISQSSSLQPYMALLNTTQRMTRATARKAGLLAQQQRDDSSSSSSSEQQHSADRPLAVLSELRDWAAGRTTHMYSKHPAAECDESGSSTAAPLAPCAIGPCCNRVDIVMCPLDKLEHCCVNLYSISRTVIQFASSISANRWQR